MSLCAKQSQCGADCLESSAFENDIMALGHVGKVRLDKYWAWGRQKAILRCARGSLSLRPHYPVGGKSGFSPSDFLSLLVLANVGVTKSNLLGLLEVLQGWQGLGRDWWGRCV